MGAVGWVRRVVLVMVGLGSWDAVSVVGMVYVDTRAAL
jgi:hypothetical protein